MHRPQDEYNPDEWDGTDYAELSDPEAWLPNRQGQGSLPDLERLARSTSGRVDVCNDYTADWPQVSVARKVAARYRCSRCSLHLVERWTDLLNTHHMNGDKSDNHLGNLLVVCIDCHNRIHGFAYSSVLPKDRTYLDALRKQQGLSFETRPRT